ncbi:MAG: hypothetical protein ACREQ5_30855, partial [Candidatus Dormibacteria bacterium]
MIFAAPAVDINTGNARLLRLADFLENDVPADRFDFAHWVGKDWAGAPDLSCGTSACALGWATTIPEFQALGLKLSGPKDAALVTYEPYASSPSYA